MAKTPPAVIKRPAAEKIVSTGPNGIPSTVTWKRGDVAVSISPAVAVEILRDTIATGVIIEMTRPMRATGTRRNANGVTATCTPDMDSPISRSTTAPPSRVVCLA